jgi:hypothetical protein
LWIEGAMPATVAASVSRVFAMPRVLLVTPGQP